MTSIQETEDNPITSTVEVVDGKMVKFPAVTIATKPVFIATIYDSLKFDCSKNWTTPSLCMEETQNLRTDFQPLIRAFVSHILSHWEFMVSKGRHFRDPKSTAWLKSIFSHWKDQETFLHNFCIFQHLAPYGLTGQREALVAVLTENFQVSPTDFEISIQAHIAQVAQQLLEKYKGHPRPPHFYGCLNPPEHLSGLLSSEYFSPWINTILMLWSSAEESKELISLGDLLLFVHDQRSDILVETNENNSEAYENTLFNLPDKMMNVLTGTESQLTVHDIVRFVSHPDNVVKSRASSVLKKSLASKENGTNITMSNGNDISDPYDLYNDNFHSNLSLALSVLKYLVQPAHAHIASRPAQDDFEEAIKFIKAKYSFKCSFIEGSCHNYDPVFRHCKFGHKMQKEKKITLTDEDCAYFRRTFGTQGIVYEFNPTKNFFDIYSDKNEYNKMFYEEIHSQDIDEETKQIVLSNKNTLDFFIYPDSIDKHALPESELTKPQLAIHHPITIPTDFMELQRGYRYSITVTPTMITTDKDLIDIPESKRGCRFKSEHDTSKNGNIFAQYSQNGCLFECQLRKAFAGPDATNCLPWDSPHVEDPISVCHGETYDHHESSQFEKMPTDDCDCPVDCDFYSYSFTFNRQPMTGVRVKNASMCEKLSKNPWQKVFLFLHKGGEWDYQYENKDECGKKYDKLLTRVTIKMDTRMVTNTRRMRWTTITDQIASLGGLVGLFTGMSMLTLMEILMWIGRNVITTIFCWQNKIAGL